MTLNLLILFSFLSEVIVLFLLEKKMWGTIYTPLNILMLPYTAVLLLSIYINSIFKLYPFDYASILIWSVGLLVFFIPSAVFNYLMPSKYLCISQQPERILQSSINEKTLFLIIILIYGIYGLHIYSSAQSLAATAAVGSDQFAEETSSGGLWGHLFVIVIALEIICFQFINKKHWWFIFPIIIATVFAVVNQVKGWVIVPLFAGILSNIMNGRIKLNMKIIPYTGLSAFGFFFLSYYLSLVYSQDKQITDDVLFFIYKNFFHYISSGVLGLSMDCSLGIKETVDPSFLFTPFVNIYNAISGNETQSGLNPYYLSTTWEGLLSNIRTFMGTIFVYGGYFYGMLTVLFFSAIAYLLRMMSLVRNTAIAHLLDSWFCALLFMGWFDYYFGLLKPYEIMLFIAIIPSALKFFKQTKCE